MRVSTDEIGSKEIEGRMKWDSCAEQNGKEGVDTRTKTHLTVLEPSDLLELSLKLTNELSLIRIVPCTSSGLRLEDLREGNADNRRVNPTPD